MNDITLSRAKAAVFKAAYALLREEENEPVILGLTTPLDDIKIVEIALHLERELNIEIPDELLEQVQTLQDFAEHTASRLTLLGEHQ